MNDPKCNQIKRHHATTKAEHHEYKENMKAYRNGDTDIAPVEPQRAYDDVSHTVCVYFDLTSLRLLVIDTVNKDHSAAQVHKGYLSMSVIRDVLQKMGKADQKKLAQNGSLVHLNNDGDKLFCVKESYAALTNVITNASDFEEHWNAGERFSLRLR